MKGLKESLVKPGVIGAIPQASVHIGTYCGPTFILSLMFWATAPCLAQDSIYVHGHVRSLEGPPLQGAQLQVGPVGPSAETNQDGGFTLGPLVGGTYRVRVRRIGFRADTIVLKVPRAADDWIIHLSQSPNVLDPVFSSALDQDLPRVMDRMRMHVGATVFGPELMKQYPGISVDDILATDSAVYPFMRGGSFPHCHPGVYLNGKPMPTPMPVTRGPFATMHTIFPDLDIRSYVRMKDIAVIEIYRNARHSIIQEPGIGLGAGTSCAPMILIWTKDFKQKPYKGH